MRYSRHKTQYAIRKTQHALRAILLATLIASCAVAAEEPIQISTEVDREQVYVGDRIRLSVIAENVAGYEVSFPEVPEELGDFTFIEAHSIEFKREKKIKAGYTYVVTVYETGMHVIPPVPVKYKRTGQSRWQIIESSQFPIEIKSLLTDEDKDIRDLKGPVIFRISVWAVMLGAVIALITLGSVWVWWRRKHQLSDGEEKVRIRSAHEIAYEELERLKAMHLPEKGLVEEYYVGLSDIIRYYLENRFSFRAPEMTTEEFMASIEKSLKLVAEQKKLLKEFLFHCDMVKFAKYGPSPLEMLDSFSAAERLVTQTRQEKQE